MISTYFQPPRFAATKVEPEPWYLDSILDLLQFTFLETHFDALTHLHPVGEATAGSDFGNPSFFGLGSDTNSDPFANFVLQTTTPSTTAAKIKTKPVE